MCWVPQTRQRHVYFSAEGKRGSQFTPCLMDSTLQTPNSKNRMSDSAAKWERMLSSKRFEGETSLFLCRYLSEPSRPCSPAGVGFLQSCLRRWMCTARGSGTQYLTSAQTTSAWRRSSHWGKHYQPWWAKSCSITTVSPITVFQTRRFPLLVSNEVSGSSLKPQARRC